MKNAFANRHSAAASCRDQNTFDSLPLRDAPTFAPDAAVNKTALCSSFNFYACIAFVDEREKTPASLTEFVVIVANIFFFFFFCFVVVVVVFALRSCVKENLVQVIAMRTQSNLFSSERQPMTPWPPTLLLTEEGRMLVVCVASIVYQLFVAGTAATVLSSSTSSSAPSARCR